MDGPRAQVQKTGALDHDKGTADQDKGAAGQDQGWPRPGLTKTRAPLFLYYKNLSVQKHVVQEFICIRSM